MVKLINALSLFAVSGLISLLLLAWLKPSSLLISFPYITFIATLALCFFVLSLVLSNVQNIALKLALGFLVLLPLVIHAYYFVDKNYLEQTQPLFIALLFLTVNLGIISSLKLLGTKKNKWLLFLCTATTVVLVVFSLARVSASIFYTGLLLILIIYSVLVLLHVILKKKAVN